MFIQDILIQSSTSLSPCIYDSNREWNYKEIYNLSKEFSILISETVPERSHIGIKINNSAQFVVAFFAVLMANCVAVPLSPFSKLSEDNRYITDCDIDAIIEGENRIVLTKPIQITELQVRQKTDTAILLITSGSVDNPKVVELTHQNIVTNLIAHSEAVNFNKNDHFFVTMPAHFSSTVTTQILSCIYLGCPISLYALPLIPRMLLTTFTKRPPTCFSAVPSMLLQLTKEAKQRSAFYEQIHTIIVSGAPLSPSLLSSVREVFPAADILQTYGLTEASPRVSITNRGTDPLSCGTAVNGVIIKIIDVNTNQELSAHEVGEVTVFGPNVMKGYYKNQSLTNSIIHNDWLHTGDLGYIDDNGCLYIVGRKKNVINTGGNIVFPEEIEKVLSDIAGIEEVMVTSMKDDLLIEIPAAFLKISDASTLDLQQLKMKCTLLLSNYKIPKKWFLTNNILKTETGKIDRSPSALKQVLDQSRLFAE